LKNKFQVVFTAQGLEGIAPPFSEDPQELKANFALLRSLRPALREFETKVREAGKQFEMEQIK